MLQQILKDMWVDPELLAELDDNQKQTLFCRMREEQVRRWKLWDSQSPAPHVPCNKAPNRKRVDFLLGEDGEPWVWVMGEHPDDLSIEEILEREAREKARQQAEKEAEQLRKSMEAELTELLDLNQKQIQALEAAQRKEADTMDIYCSVDELRDRIKLPFPNNNTNNNINNTIEINIPEKRDALQEISFNTSQTKKVSQRVALWEKRVMEERTSEIFRRIQRKQKEVAKEAEEEEHKKEQVWREQERKAKEAEMQIREIARRAREEHRRTSVLDMDVELQNVSNKATVPAETNNSQSNQNGIHSNNSMPTAKPESKEAVVEWFRSSEIARRAGLEQSSGQVVPWFHGLISRQEAESLLQDQPTGTFLVRVSERIWGYAISYKDNDRCKHYLVDASNGHYQFLGANQLSHNTLGDLIKYHGEYPITILGCERLLSPCPRTEIPSIFNGLIPNLW